MRYNKAIKILKEICPPEMDDADSILEFTEDLQLEGDLLRARSLVSRLNEWLDSELEK